MKLNKRNNPIIVDTVFLAQDSDLYAPVKRDGTIASANSDIFGITLASGSTGDPVAVCRLGFCPVKIATASIVDDEKVELVVSSNGLLTAASAVGSETVVVAISEEAGHADGAQVGAWVDALSAGRSREYGS